MIAILFVFGKFISIPDDNASSVVVATAATATATAATAIITYIATTMIIGPTSGHQHPLEALSYFFGHWRCTKARFPIVYERIGLFPAMYQASSRYSKCKHSSH